MAEVTCDNKHKLLATLTPDAPLASVPTWTVQSGDSTVDPQPGGLSAFLVSGDNAADSTIIAEAEGDKMPGVNKLSVQITLHVTAAEASTLGVSFGNPVLK